MMGIAFLRLSEPCGNEDKMKEHMDKHIAIKTYWGKHTVKKDHRFSLGYMIKNEELAVEEMESSRSLAVFSCNNKK